VKNALHCWFTLVVQKSLEVRDADTVVEFVRGCLKNQKKSHGSHKMEFTNRRFTRISQKRCTMLSVPEVLDIGRDVRQWKSTHSFIEPCVLGDFDALSFGVEPKDVLGGVWWKAEEHTFA